MEIDATLAKENRRAVQVQTGRTLSAEGVLAFSPESEATVIGLPAYTKLRKFLQDPSTGAFFFTMGISAIDSTDALR